MDGGGDAYPNSNQVARTIPPIANHPSKRTMRPRASAPEDSETYIGIVAVNPPTPKPMVRFLLAEPTHDAITYCDRRERKPDKSLTSNNSPRNQLSQRKGTCLNNDSNQGNASRKKDRFATTEFIAQKHAAQGTQSAADFINRDRCSWNGMSD